MLKTKPEKPSQKANDFIKYISSQSLSPIVTMGAFLVDCLIRGVSKIAGGVPVIDEGRIALIIYATIFPVAFVIWIVSRLRTRKIRRAEIEKLRIDINHICDEAEVDLQRYENMSTTTDNTVKYILKAANLTFGELSKATFEQIRERTNSYENYRDAENTFHEADTKKNNLKLTLKLVEDVTKNIREQYLKIIGFYIMHNTEDKNDKKLLKITQNKDDNNFDAFVYDKFGHEHRFEVIYADEDNNQRVARLVLSYSEHHNPDLFIFNVDNGDFKFDRSHRCTYIKNNTHDKTNYNLMLLSEQLMGLSSLRLSDIPITEDTFKEIVSMATNGNKRSLGLV